jgi:putative FmdB family regulatory protein
MPTYEYACKDCGEHLEVVQSFKDDALTECPSCSGNLRKVFSAAGIIFKGSGWHVKDYASKGASTSTTAGSGEGSSDSSDSSDSSGTSSGSSESSSSDSGSSSAESA